MRRQLFGLAVALGCAASVPALAQSADGAVAMAESYATDYAAGLPDFIVDSSTACYRALIGGLSEEDQATIAAEPDFIAGVNALATARPELPETLFPALDNCVFSISVGEFMWGWVRTEHLADASVEEQIALGSCLMPALDALVLDGKRGIARFRFGNFYNSIEAMLFERPDLAGTIQDDMAECGIEVEARLVLMPQQ